MNGKEKRIVYGVLCILFIATLVIAFDNLQLREVNQRNYESCKEILEFNNINTFTGLPNSLDKNVDINNLFNNGVFN